MHERDSFSASPVPVVMRLLCVICLLESYEFPALFLQPFFSPKRRTSIRGPEAELLSARRPVSLPLRYPGAASAATKSINHKGIFSFFASGTDLPLEAKRAKEAVAFLASLIQEHEISHPTRALGDLRSNETSMEVMQGSILFVPEFRDIVAVASPLRHREQLQVAYANQWVTPTRVPIRMRRGSGSSLLTRIDNMIGYTLAALIVPPRTSIINYEPWASDPRFIQLFQNTLLSKNLPLDSPHIDQARREFIQPALNRIMYEGAPPSELAEAERLANAWLEERL